MIARQFVYRGSLVVLRPEAVVYGRDHGGGYYYSPLSRYVQQPRRGPRWCLDSDSGVVAFDQPKVSIQDLLLA